MYVDVHAAWYCQGLCQISNFKANIGSGDVRRRGPGTWPPLPQAVRTDGVQCSRRIGARSRAPPGFTIWSQRSDLPVAEPAGTCLGDDPGLGLGHASGASDSDVSVVRVGVRVQLAIGRRRPTRQTVGRPEVELEPTPCKRCSPQGATVSRRLLRNLNFQFASHTVPGPAGPAAAGATVNRGPDGLRSTVTLHEAAPATVTYHALLPPSRARRD